MQTSGVEEFEGRGKAVRRRIPWYCWWNCSPRSYRVKARCCMMDVGGGERYMQQWTR